MKYTSDGSFDELKSRLVAGGHQQDRKIHTKMEVIRQLAQRQYL